MGSPRILFCTTGVFDTVGGIASANRNVLAALQGLAAETGGTVETLALGEAGPGKPGYRTFRGDKIRFALASVLNGLRSDLVVFDHVQLSRPIFFLPRFLRPKVVLLAHGSEATWRLRPASATAFRHADLVLTNSHYTLRRMGDYLTRFNGAACPLGLPPQFEIQPAPPPTSTEPIVLEAADGVSRALGDKVLLLVSRLDATEREKGHRELLSVFPRVLKAFPNAQLVFVGAGSDLEPLKTIARASGLGASVFLPGRLLAGALEAMYHKAFAYVMPSRQEGFGLVYLEAMNYAKPCLACHDDGGADVVADGETGVLVAHDIDEAELLRALTGLLADPARARRLGEAGWRRLLDQFTSAAHQARVTGLIRPLLKGRAP